MTQTTATTKPRFNLSQIFGTYGLLIIAVLFAAFFSLLLPRTFPTALTVRAILNDRAPIALLSLSALIVIAIGEFDLLLGYLVGLAHIVAVGLQSALDGFAEGSETADIRAASARLKTL